MRVFVTVYILGKVCTRSGNMRYFLVVVDNSRYFLDVGIGT